MKINILMAIFASLSVHAFAEKSVCVDTYDIEDNAFVCQSASKTSMREPAIDEPVANERITSLVSRIERGGRVYEFVDEGNGIGVAEIVPAGVRPLMSEITSTGEFSPLELFLALNTKDHSAPIRLVEDHERFAASAGRMDSDPRPPMLGTAAPIAYSVDEGYDTGICNYNDSWNPGHSEFTWAWFWGIGVSKDFTAQQAYFASDLNGTSGKRWYAGNSRERWLGACNGNYVYGFPAFEFRAEFRNYQGNWVAAYRTQLEPYHYVRYHSFTSPRRWRVRLRELGYDVMLNREYAVAVAGNEPLGLGFGN